MNTLAVLAAVMLALALVVPASAGPFLEVPAGHWAYATLTELAATGLVEGYPVGAILGDRPITRYELAVIVARTLARLDSFRVPGSTHSLNAVRRLATEFGPDLQALGVHISSIVPERAATSTSRMATRGAGRLRSRDDLRTLRYPDPGHLARLDLGERAAGQTSYDLVGLVRASAPNEDPWHLGLAAGGALDELGAASLGDAGGALSAHTLGLDSLSDWALPSGAVGLPFLAIRGDGRSLDIGAGALVRHHAFADWATWSNIPSLAAATAFGAPSAMVGSSFDLAWLGADAWSPALILGYRLGAPQAVAVAAPSHSSFAWGGQDRALDVRGWLAQLNLSFTPRTAGSLRYERGQLTQGGQPYTEWALRMAHRMAPNATVAVNYSRTSCGSTGGTPCPGLAAAGALERLYRAELLYSW